MRLEPKIKTNEKVTNKQNTNNVVVNIRYLQIGLSHIFRHVHSYMQFGHIG